MGGREGERERERERERGGRRKRGKKGGRGRMGGEHIRINSFIIRGGLFMKVAE